MIVVKETDEWKSKNGNADFSIEFSTMPFLCSTFFTGSWQMISIIESNLITTNSPLIFLPLNSHLLGVLEVSGRCISEV
jgi:hypothetical protein